MRKIFFVFVSAVLILTSSLGYAQDKTEQIKYESVVKLSSELKAYEVTHWPVWMVGEFATEVPDKESPEDIYLLRAQNKLKLARNYMGMDVLMKSEQSPDLSGLQGLKKRDVFLSTIEVAGTVRVTKGLAEENLAWQITTILHEDFHSFGRKSVNLRSIEEGFAEAFSYFAASQIAEDVKNPTVGGLGVPTSLASGDSEKLSAELEELAERNANRYLAINRCYEKLDTLYRSSLARKEKLEKREAIFQECDKAMSWENVESNNAVFSFMITYSRYYFYAIDKLKEFGIEKFLRAYLRTLSREPFGLKKAFRFLRTPLGMSNDAAEEKNWLRRFEKNLAEAEPTSVIPQ